jgi:hypothetical protein
LQAERVTCFVFLYGFRYDAALFGRERSSANGDSDQ